MKKIMIGNFSSGWAIACLLLVITGCQKNMEKPADKITDRAITAEGSSAKNPKSLKDFVQVNLVGDNTEYSPAHIDGNLVNGWGITFPTSGPAWVSAEGTGKSTVYSGEGVAAGISPVSIPGAGVSTAGHPTGIVFNSSSTDFKLPNGNPARFIFAGADGVISGWNGGSTAIKKVDDSPAAVYLGIALAADGSNHFLYVANFAEGKIDVYDTAWHEVNKPFFDSGIPDLAISSVKSNGNKLMVIVANKGGKPVPVDLVIYYKDNSTEKIHRSIAVWEKGNASISVSLSASRPVSRLVLTHPHTSDSNPKDNIYEMK